jgi:hypothetical protein
VTDARTALQGSPAIAATIKSHKADVEAAYATAEQAAIAAGAVPQKGGETTDPGFLEAKKRVQQLYEMLDTLGAPAPTGDAGTP